MSGPETKPIRLNLRTAIVLVLLGTSLLSLQTPQREYLFPWAPFLMLGLQVAAFALVLPLVRVRNTRWVLLLIFIWLGLFTFSLASALWSEHSYLVLQRTLLVYLPALLLALMVVSDPKPERTFNQVAVALACFGFVLAFIGLLLHFFGSVESMPYGRVQTITVGPWSFSQLVLGPEMRISSLTGNPNTLAAWLMITLAVSFYLYLRRKVGFPRAAILIGVQVAALLLTYSRTGIVSTVLILAVMYYYASPKLRVRLCRATLMLALGGVAVALLFCSGFVEILGLRLSLENLLARVEAWSFALAGFLDKPLSGAGFGVSFESLLEPAGLPITAHSSHLAILAEIGFVGYGLFLAFWLLPMVIVFRMAKSGAVSNSKRLLLVTSGAILLGFFLHQFFETSIMRYGFYTLFWTYLIFLIVSPNLYSSYDT